MNVEKQTQHKPTASDGAEVDAKTVFADESATLTGEAIEAHPPGDKVGKYEIRRQLGSGGMGAVYLGFDPLIEREVAVKILSATVSASDAAIKRFLQEARSIGKLNHPGVVSIYEIDQVNGEYYIVMELLTGGSLSQVVHENGPLAWPEACRIAAQAAAGLGAAHEAGMVHRDVKPENLMLSKDGQVKVVDFGLSKLIDAVNDTQAGVTKVGQILGTPQYMSPEQFESGEVDARTDIYSLGATLFRLLTGRFPFHDATSIVQVMTAHLTKPVPAAADVAPDVPDEVQRIIAKAMAKRPEERYQTADEMAADLWAAIRGKGSSTSAAESGPSAIESRPLASALLIEPSKMQAAILRDAVVRAGAGRVVVASSAAEADGELQAAAPDLLVTAMQLSDARGIDVIARLSNEHRLDRACVVLNSNDSTIDDVLDVGSAASLVLAPKKSRPDDVLRVVHAAGPLCATSGAIVAPVDPLGVRIAVVTDFDAMPEALTDIIRQSGVLDVSICGSSDAGSPSAEAPSVVLILRTAGKSTGDHRVYVKMAQGTSNLSGLTSAVQVDDGRLYLRAVHRQGVIAATYQRLDAARLECLLQACRPA